MQRADKAKRRSRMGHYVRRIAALAGALASAGAQAQSIRQPAMLPALAPIAPADGLPVAVATDDSARLSVPVTIGGSSWNFLIDTASTRSVIASDVADSLNLAKGDTLQILNIAGTESVPSVIIPEIAFSGDSIRDVHAPSLLRSNLGGDGLLGLDMLHNSRVSIDFRHAATLTVAPSSRKPESDDNEPGAIVVVGRSRMGELIVTNADVDGVRVVVILDTGSQGSIGNPALATILARKSPRQMPSPTTMISVTGRIVPANYRVVGRLQLDSLTIQNVPVAFADVATFERFGLSRRPAILLGIDTLRLFGHVTIDFPRHEIKFWLPHDKHERRAIAESMTSG